MQTLVFVYGSLRKGASNHALLTGASFCGYHVTTARYTMRNLGHYPGITVGGSTRISGEVYRIGKKHLHQLDRLEDYPILYTRRLISTCWGKAWIYIYRGHRSKRPIIRSGDWMLRQGDHHQHGENECKREPPHLLGA